MGWVRIDDTLFGHAKISAAGRDGTLLWLAAICWSSTSATDGHIPARVLPRIGRDAMIRDARTTADHLVDVGLFDTASDGWTIHDYLRYQRSRASVDAERERWREQKRAQRLGQSTVDTAISTGPMSAVDPANTSAVENDVQTVFNVSIADRPDRADAWGIDTPPPPVIPDHERINLDDIRTALNRGADWKRLIP